MGLRTLIPLLSLAFATGIHGDCTPNSQTANNIKPVAANGWKWSVVASNLGRPRSILFDSRGRLLVLESQTGDITSLELDDGGGVCVKEKSRKSLSRISGLNHGLSISKDGSSLYASTSDVAYSFSYDGSSQALSNQKTIVKGMDNPDHNTRTLTKSYFDENQLLVSRGSNDNIDSGAADITTGRSQIKAFDLTQVPSGGYNYNTDGRRLGWGLRNSVGVTEHPLSGGIYSVENSGDNIKRDNVDVHETNPGEEMNFHGTLNNNVYAPQGSNYGYPTCFTAYDTSVLPKNASLKTGSPFALDSSGDAKCNDQTTAPRITFEAHMAPLDIKFNTGGGGTTQGQKAWVTFHGSWDRSNPAGYKVGYLSFYKDGTPAAMPYSKDALKVVMWNADNSKCPNNCFRPVGIAFDSSGRMFFSSDASGEIYVLDKS